MDERLKQLSETLGKMGVSLDVAKLAPDNQKALSDFLSPQNSVGGSPGSNPIKDSLTRPPTDPFDAKQLQLARAEEALASRRANRPDVFVKDNKTATRLNNIDDARDRKEIFAELGIDDPQADEYAPYLNQDKSAILGGSSEAGTTTNRLDAFKAAQKAPQAEAARRQGIRDDAALPISDNIKNGLTGRDIFKDSKGNIEGPGQLKDRMIKEGASRGDAEIAAGQRYRDMFDLPNAKSEGFGMRGGQRDAVLNAKPEDRMGIMDGLKSARADNLKALTEQRMADPNRKQVGMVTEITSGMDGQVLARRGEGDARVARGGTQGAMGGTVDVPGKLELTQAGENAIRDRLTVNKTADGATTVTGRYGTAVGGKSTLDQMKDQGLVAKDFQLTSEQKTGQAPLPKEYTDAKTKMLADAGQTAKRDGAVVGDAKPLLDRMAPGTGEAVDRKYDKIATDLKQQQSDKLGNDFLNAYKTAGGKVGTPNSNAPSPGPRTDQEKTAMQGFLNSNDELKRKLARR